MSMNSVMTVRLPETDVKAIEEIALWEKTDKSTTVRDLVELGKLYFAIRSYKQGHISFGKAAELAGISLSEMMDVLASLGVESTLDVQDYLEGKKTAEKLFG